MDVYVVIPLYNREEHIGKTLESVIDHDDLSHPEHLQRLYRSLENEPSSPLAIASKADFRDGKNPQYSISSYNYSLRDPWEGYPGNPFGEPCLASFDEMP